MRPIYRPDADLVRVTASGAAGAAVVEGRARGLSFGDAVRAALGAPAAETPAPVQVDIEALMQRWAVAVLRFHEGNADFDVPLDELLDWVSMYAEPLDFEEWLAKRFP